MLNKSTAALEVAEWMENGCRLALLVDPRNRTVHIYRVDGSVDSVGFDVKLSGEDDVPGFRFDPKSFP